MVPEIMKLVEPYAFMISLDHEIIHAYDYNLLIGKMYDLNSYSEAHAYTFSQQYYPGLGQEFINQYHGLLPLNHFPDYLINVPLPKYPILLK